VSRRSGRLILGALLISMSSGLIAVSAAVVAPAAAGAQPSPCYDGSYTSSTTCTIYGSGDITVEAAGADGGAGAAGYEPGGSGGAGSDYQVSVPVSLDNTLTITVGTAGNTAGSLEPSPGASGGSPGGANGGSGDSSTARAGGGGGGGYSQVLDGSTNLLVAGGGGGGGGGGHSQGNGSSDNGGAGGSNGGNGGSGEGTAGVAGASASANGTSGGNGGSQEAGGGGGGGGCKGGTGGGGGGGDVNGSGAGGGAGASCTGVGVALDHVGANNGSNIDGTTGGTDGYVVLSGIPAPTPPSATISSPANNQRYTLNQVVPVSWSCTEAAGMPGLSDCYGDGVSDNGDFYSSEGVLTSDDAGDTDDLITSSTGPQSFTVTVDSFDGAESQATIDYNVSAAGPATPVVGTVLDDAAGGGPWSGSEATGASAYDTATVTSASGATPTGTVTYNFFDNGTCDSTPFTTDTETLSSGTVPNSGATGALGVGSYSFDASYSGDSNYTAVTSDCEPFSVAKAPASVGTVVDDAAAGGPWSGSEATGASAYDTSTVSGVADITPTGTLTYSFFDNNTCNGTPSTTDTVGLSNGTEPNSGSTGALGAGSYSFQASYSGDGNYNASSSDCEPFGVAKTSALPGTVVNDVNTSAPWNDTEVLGASAYDTSTVSGIAGFTPTGTSTYNFFDNATCNGTPSTTDTVTLSGGTVPNSGATGALGVGSYSFDASYSGDSNYTASTSDCEPFDVAKASASPGTVVDDAASNGAWSGNEVTGASAYDTSTVTSRDSVPPTGTVTYNFFTNGTCNGTPSTTDTVILSNGTVPNSGTTGALGAGSYSFDASYSGDSNYISSTSDCEPFGVAKTSASPGTAVDDSATSAAWDWAEVTGASAYDTSTVTGAAGFTPTGTVTYNFFGNATCKGTPSTSGTVTLIAGVVPDSGATGPLGTGNYSFDASYSGDSNYISSTSGCEPFGVAKASAPVGTAVDDAAGNSAWSGSEVTGASAYDTSTVSGVTGLPPTGTVTYNLFANGTCAFPASATPVTLSNGTVPNSGTTGALGAGSYSFDASYSGDSNYLSSTSGCEPFSVAPAQPSVGTVVDNAATNAAWSGTETTGASAYDTSSVSAVAGFTPTGTVTYSFFDNGTCNGTPSTTDSVSLGGGTVPNSTKTAALGAGSYSFQASYSGDGSYTSSSGSCETFSVATVSASVGTVVDDAATNAIWSGKEVIGASAYDTSTVSGVAGFTPTGAVTYSFFDNNTCNGAAAATSTVALSGGTVPKSSTTATLSAGPYSFQASYSGDSNYKISTSSCEAFSVVKDTTTTTVSQWPTTVTYGDESVAVFSVTVTTKHGETVPNGETVTVDVGSASCTATLSADKGSCTIAKTALPVGWYSVSATYGGDANLDGSSAWSGAKFGVTKDSTATTVSQSPTTVTYGNESVAVFSVTVTTHYGEVAPNGETVTVDAGFASCTATLSAGKGTCTIPETALPVGSYWVAAGYGGDANLGWSIAAGATKLIVTKDATTTAVSVSPTSVSRGSESAAVFSVTVTTHFGEAVPKGETVKVTVGSASCTATLSAGKGTCTIGKSALPGGSYSVSASYGGDSNLSGSSAAGGTKLIVT